MNGTWKEITHPRKDHKDVKEEQASVHQACQCFYIDKSQHHHQNSKLKEWSERLTRPSFGSETSISGGGTKAMKRKKNASHLDDIEDALLGYIFEARGTLLNNLLSRI